MYSVFILNIVPSSQNNTIREIKYILWCLTVYKHVCYIKEVILTSSNYKSCDYMYKSDGTTSSLAEYDEEHTKLLLDALTYTVCHNTNDTD